MKKFHKTVTPPPRTAFMKSLFRNLTGFQSTFIFLNKRYENFHKIPLFSGDGFPYEKIVVFACSKSWPYLHCPAFFVLISKQSGLSN